MIGNEKTKNKKTGQEEIHKASKIVFATETELQWLSALRKMVKLFEKETRHCKKTLFSIAKINLKSRHLQSYYLSSWAQIRTSLYLKLVSPPPRLDVHCQQACRNSCYFFSVKCALFIIFSRCRDLIKESGPLVFPAPEQTNTFCHNANRKA